MALPALFTLSESTFIELTVLIEPVCIIEIAGGWSLWLDWCLK